MKTISTTSLMSVLPSEPNFKTTKNIEKYTKKILISTESVTPQNTAEGIFLLDLKSKSLNQLYKGNFAGLKQYKHHFYVLQRDLNELWILDKHFHRISQIPLNPISNIGELHGLDISSDGLIYIVGASNNKVLILESKTMQKKEELILTHEKFDFHHMNDICVTDNDIYLSMFSIHHQWDTLKEISAGVVVKFDRNTLLPKSVVSDGLRAPHSVTISQNHLYFCDSLNMNVCRVDLKSKDVLATAQFHGFTRGLYLDGEILIVGQSEMRHLQGLDTRFSNISLQAGIHIFDIHSNIGQFIPLPVSNVYSVVPV